MPGRALGDKVEELQKAVVDLTKRADWAGSALEELSERQEQAAAGVAELKAAFVRTEYQLAELNRFKNELAALADLKTELAIQKRDLEELKKVREEWTRRLWAMAGPILGALVGVVLGYFLRRG